MVIQAANSYAWSNLIYKFCISGADCDVVTRPVQTCCRKCSCDTIPKLWRFVVHYAIFFFLIDPELGQNRFYIFIRFQRRYDVIRIQFDSTKWHGKSGFNCWWWAVGKGFFKSSVFVYIQTYLCERAVPLLSLPPPPLSPPPRKDHSSYRIAIWRFTFVTGYDSVTTGP